MAQGVLFAVGVIFLLGISVCPITGHICLLDPPQRGKLNVSDPGDITCFKPNGPCGSTPSAAPKVFLQAGSGYPVLFQQNLNHYNPGWPGFLDVAWAMGASPRSEDFTTLATVPDYWPHLQAQQTNFTVVVKVPDISCAHCTLRVRYHPNKPTEPIFHNCADIAIVKTNPLPQFGRLFGLATFGYFKDTYLVELGLDGSLTKINGPLPVRMSAEKTGNAAAFSGFVYGMVSINPKQQQLYFLGYGSPTEAVNNSLPNTFVTFDVNRKVFLDPVAVTSPSANSQWVVLIPNLGGTTFPAFILELLDDPTNGHQFQVRSLTFNGQVTAPIGVFPFDDTFVNYLWAEYDHLRGFLYILSGDENSLFALNVRLFVVNVRTNQVSFVNVDNTRYTVSSISLDISTGNLYSLSPGLYPQQQPIWSLVQINPTSGAVRLVGNLPDANLGDSYGGGVYGSSIHNPSKTILHLFKKSDTGATVLNAVDLVTGSKVVSSTAFDLGVNNGISLNTVVYLPPQ